MPAPGTDQAACIIDLFNVCEQEIVTTQCTRLWFDEFTKNAVGRSMLTISKRFTGKSDLTEEEALKAFADKGARRLLWTAPNQFWFWTILKDSWLHHGRIDRRIPYTAVRNAIEIKRSHLGANGLGDLSTMDPLRACLLLESGALILKRESAGKSGLILNPYFCQENLDNPTGHTSSAQIKGEV